MSITASRWILTQGFNRRKDFPPTHAIFSLRSITVKATVRFLRLYLMLSISPPPAPIRRSTVLVRGSDGRIIKIDMFTGRLFSKLTIPASSNSIAALLIDTSGTIWAATDNALPDALIRHGPSTNRGDTFRKGRMLPCSGFFGIIWAGFRQPLISSMVTTGLSYFDGQIWRMLFRSHFSQKRSRSIQPG